MRRLDVANASTMVIKLAVAGNLPRAVRLCESAPDAAYLAALGRALAVAQAADPERNRDFVRGEIDDAYKAEAARRIALLRRGAGASWLAGALAVGAAAATLAQPPLRPVVLVISAAGLALVARRSRMVGGMARGVEQAAGPTVEAITEAVVSRKTGFPST